MSCIFFFHQSLLYRRSTTPQARIAVTMSATPNTEEQPAAEEPATAVEAPAAVEQPVAAKAPVAEEPSTADEPKSGDAPQQPWISIEVAKKNKLTMHEGLQKAQCQPFQKSPVPAHVAGSRPSHFTL